MDQPIERCSFHDRPQLASSAVLKRLRASVLDDVKPSRKDSDSIKLRFTVCILKAALYPHQFTEMYKNAIIDLDMKDDLERSSTINWCRTAKPLFPMKTTGDGNCLLHAVSLSLWGMEDSDQFLRRLLYLNITTDGKGMYKKRWLAHQRQSSNIQRLEFRINTEEYSVEWETVIRATEDLLRQGNHALPYTSLESIHLYVLANILCRPIIMLADRIARNVYGQSLQESEIGGIYLPLESPSVACHKNAIVLGYNLNHFAPLVFEENDLSMTDSMQVVPIVSYELNSLPVHYLLLDEEPYAQRLLMEYMNVKEIVYTGKDGPLAIPSVQIKHEPLPRELNLMEAYKTDCEIVYRNLTGEDLTQNRQPFQFEQRNRIATQNIGGATHVNVMPNNAVNIVQGDVFIGHRRPDSKPVRTNKEKKCLAMGCKMFGIPETGGYCSKCFKKGTVQFHKQEEEAKQHRYSQVERNHPSQVHVAGGQQHNGYQDISIMGEDCVAGCGFKCSTETYPYCHECNPKFGQVKHQQVPRLEDQSEVQLSMLPENCITEGCSFRCSTATKPYCHQCYDGQMTLLQKSATAPPESITQAGGSTAQGNNYHQSQMAHPHETAVTCKPVVRDENVRFPPTQRYAPMETNRHSPIEVQEGMLPKKCKIGECLDHAIRGNDGMCESCYNASMFGAGNDSSPHPPDHQSSFTNQHKEDRICKSPNCKVKAKPGFEQCISCFLKEGEMPSHRGLVPSGHMPMNISEPEKDEKILNSGAMPKPTQQSTWVPSAVQLQTRRQAEYGLKQKCVTERCEGMHLDNEFGLCSTCYNKVRAKSDLEMSDPFASCSPVELSEQEVKLLNPVIVSSKQKIKCSSPFCEEMIYPPKAYCEECLSALQEARAKKALEDNKHLASDNRTPCKTEGCKFLRNPELNGFCTQCFRGKSSGPTNSAPLLSANKIQVSSESKPDTAPLMKKPGKYSNEHCVVHGCQLYGDPSQYNRCSKHYKEAKNPPIFPMEVGETVSLREKVDPFIKRFSKVEGNLKTKILCKNNLSKGCQNFGNAKNKGYCNRCFPELHQKELNQQMAVAGGNRFG